MATTRPAARAADLTSPPVRPGQPPGGRAVRRRPHQGQIAAPLMLYLAHLLGKPLERRSAAE
ncbi:MAG: hypothetical protein ACRDQ5_06110 [Sciscionella sp.]